MQMMKIHFCLEMQVISFFRPRQHSCTTDSNKIFLHQFLTPVPFFPGKFGFILPYLLEIFGIIDLLNQRIASFSLFIFCKACLYFIFELARIMEKQSDGSKSPNSNRSTDCLHIIIDKQHQ